MVSYYGDGVAKVAEKLLIIEMYDFVCSNVHHGRHIAAFEQRVMLKDLVPCKEVITNNQFFNVNCISVIVFR